MGKYNDFEKELTKLINSHSMENESNLPDWIIARHMMIALENLESLIRKIDSYRNKS